MGGYMKTLQDLDSFIEKNTKEVDMLLDKGRNMTDSDRKAIRKMKDQNDYYREIKMYLSTNPTEEYLNKELNRIENRLRLLYDGYKAWSDGQKRPFKNDQEKLQIFNKEMDIPKLKTHLKNVRFILNV